MATLLLDHSYPTPHLVLALPTSSSSAIVGTQASKNTTVQSYERLHKIVIEYVCRQAGLDRALADEAAGEEVSEGEDRPTLERIDLTRKVHDGGRNEREGNPPKGAAEEKREET